MIVGALMVARSDLVDVRPFRTGLIVLAFGLMITLGKDEGGYVGTCSAAGSRSPRRHRRGDRRGADACSRARLLVTGASAGAMLRSSGRAVHRAARKSLPPRRPAPRLRVIEGEATAPLAPLAARRWTW